MSSARTILDDIYDAWRDHDLERDQVLRRMAPIETALPAAWPLVLKVVDQFCASGILRTKNEELRTKK